jgi:quinol monooxygenase YgiN
MSGHALFIQHRTRPGLRDEVQRVWQKHMAPAVTANPGHTAYVYGFGDHPDAICAFQHYASRDAAAAFLRTAAYAAYQAEVQPLLLGEPLITVLDVQWSKDA